MSRLIFQQEGDWIRLLGPPIRQFIDFLKYGIKPNTFRRYEAESRSWMVHWKHLRSVANTARRFYDDCDWSTLPPEWQMVAAGGEPVAIPEMQEENPFAVLFLTDDAPLEVIIGAYRALAKVNHPDAGGTDEQMAKLTNAYKRARALREH
jgi:hypothetical protein